MDLPPTTTNEQNLTTAGQRKVNLIWEYTQAVIALMLVAALIVSALKIAFRGGTGQEIPVVLATLCGTVVGSYFQRTNHMNVGGVGRKSTDDQPYIGR